MERRRERQVTVRLPPLPAPERIADLSREAAARERVEPQLVEKDFYLTRLLWALGQRLEAGLLLIGGTLLCKVDLGFFRMSEDADFIVPASASRMRSINVPRLAVVRDALKEVCPIVGVRAALPAGTLSNAAAHGEWRLEYPSEFGPQNIKVEAVIRKPVEAPRRVRLKQLISDSSLGGYEDAFCFAVTSTEARAEKVRAAHTREAIRDFYDLARLIDAEADLSSASFVRLVDQKLTELNAPPLFKQPSFGAMDRNRRRILESAMKRELPSVLRADAPPFDLDETFRRLDAAWEPLRRS